MCPGAMQSIEARAPCALRLMRYGFLGTVTVNGESWELQGQQETHTYIAAYIIHQLHHIPSVGSLCVHSAYC